jgi:hypothetical protein
MKWQERAIRSVYLVTGKIDLIHATSRQRKEAAKKYKELVKEITPVPEKSHLETSNAIGAMLQGLVDSGGTDVTLGMKGFLGSMIVASWTAVESLLEDLWVTALDGVPSFTDGYLHQPGSQATKSFSPREVLALARIFGDDLPNKMGTALRDFKKVEFVALDKIEEIYKRTFDNAAGHIFKEPDIWLLDLVRNSLVHNSGRIDKRFVTGRDGIEGLKDDVFEKLQVGQEMPLNAAIAERFVSKAIAFGTRLIKFVNGKVTAIAPKNKP